MRSKTPHFDAALDAHYSKLAPDENGGLTRNCRISGKPFYIRPDDVAFYKSIRVPLPTVSPDERHRQKWAFYNIYNLFRTKSALSGNPMISMYLPNTPYTIYEHKEWFGGKWDPMDYGRDADPAKPFFEQFHRLTLDVPRYNLFVDPASNNSDYANVVLHVNNCYLVFDSVESRDCWYGAGLLHSIECMDANLCFHSDACYEMNDVQRMHNSAWCENVRDCRDSYFLYDCRDCESCFGGVNLRHRKYYFWNEPLSKDAYAARMKDINLGSRAAVALYKKQFEELKKRAIHPPNRNENSNNCVGNWLKNCVNTYQSSFMDGAQNVVYSTGGFHNRDSYHCFGGVNGERGYEDITGLNTYGSKFGYFNKEVRNAEYCWDSLGCEDCFGCVGLAKKKWCIFNKQYTEGEYWERVDALKTAMLERSEYGEFYPPALSPFPYNISLATSYIGYDDVEEARRLGYPVADIPETAEQESRGDMIAAQDLPDDIRDVRDDILAKTLRGTDGKKFRVIASELAFYRARSIPLPQENPVTRLQNLRRAFGSVRLRFYTRACPKCGQAFETVYPPDDPRIVYCESCYRKAVG